MGLLPQICITISLIISLHKCCVYSEGCVSLYMKYNSLAVFEDKAVSDFLLQTLDVVERLGRCARQCAHDIRCRSYQFNNITGTCSLFASGFSTPDRVFNPVSAEVGSRLYLVEERQECYQRECLMTADCCYGNTKCIQGSCGCQVGYIYDPSSNNCVTHCVVYGDTYLMFPDTKVEERNNLILPSQTLPQCMQACIDATTFSCVSFDYVVDTGMCHMSSSSWFDQPVSERGQNVPGIDLYQRNCAV